MERKQIIKNILNKELNLARIVEISESKLKLPEKQYLTNSEESHIPYLMSKNKINNKEYTNESVLIYYKPLLEYVAYNKKHLQEQLITENHLPKTIVNKIFQQKPEEITENLLQILKPQIIKSLLNEGLFKCSIEDVEKRAKKIIFVKYNWDPKNVVFLTKHDVVQITAVQDLKKELIKSSNKVIFEYLDNLAKTYKKDLDKEFAWFCGNLPILSSLTTQVTSQVYCYTVIKRRNNFYLLNSNKEKKKLTRGDHPQYTVNKLYYKIGLFANNVKKNQ